MDEEIVFGAGYTYRYNGPSYVYVPVSMGILFDNGQPCVIAVKRGATDWLAIDERLFREEFKILESLREEKP